MEYKLLTHNHKRLLLFFTGWGMDWHPFATLSHPSYDIAIVWDYRSTDGFSWEWARDYTEIAVLAWSLGVFMLPLVARPILPRITASIAAAGSPWPADDTRGIPDLWFRATMENVTDDGLHRFRRRMCGSGAATAAFLQTAPERTLADLEQELRHIYALSRQSEPATWPWDAAVIAERDGIFPAENLRRAWEGVHIDTHFGNSHLLDFQQIINHYFIDKDKVGQRFAAGAKTYGQNDHIQREIGRQLLSRLQKVFVNPRKIIEIGGGSGFLSQALPEAFPTAEIETWDIVDRPGIENFHCVDAETHIQSLPASDSRISAIVSASTVQWFNSPQRFVAQCLRVVPTGGILAFSTFVRGNLAEISRITGTALPCLTLREWQNAIPPRFEIIDICEMTMQVTMDSARDILAHLRDTGVNGLQTSPDAARRVLRELQPDADGRYTITYRPAFFILRKK